MSKFDEFEEAVLDLFEAYKGNLCDPGEVEDYKSLGWISFDEKIPPDNLLVDILFHEQDGDIWMVCATTPDLVRFHVDYEYWRASVPLPEGLR